MGRLVDDEGEDVEDVMIGIPLVVYEHLMRLAIVTIVDAGGAYRMTREGYMTALTRLGARSGPPGHSPGVFHVQVDGDDLVFTMLVGGHLGDEARA